MAPCVPWSRPRGSRRSYLWSSADNNQAGHEPGLIVDAMANGSAAMQLHKLVHQRLLSLYMGGIPEDAVHKAQTLMQV